MNKVTFYHMAEKILYAIYTETFSKERLVEIMGEKEKPCSNIIYEETIFLNNLLKNYPWYTIPSLLKRFKSIVSDEKNRPPSLNLACNQTVKIIEDLDFIIEERIKTIICININECLYYVHYKSDNSDNELKEIVKKKCKIIEQLTNLSTAEEDLYLQRTFIQEEGSKEQELREKISKRNVEEKESIYEIAKKDFRNYLNRQSLSEFQKRILKILKEIAVEQQDPYIYTIGFEVLNLLYESTLRAWKRRKKGQQESPLLYLINKQKS